jgi:hypothetical protein
MAMGANRKAFPVRSLTILENRVDNGVDGRTLEDMASIAPLLLFSSLFSPEVSSDSQADSAPAM